MDEKMIATFYLGDDLLKAIHYQESPQCQMNDAEVMTTALVAALFFRGQHESARAMLKQHGDIPQMLSKGRFSRRLHRVNLKYYTYELQDGPSFILTKLIMIMRLKTFFKK